MKYLILLGDGMADYRYPELGGITPLQYARVPNMDWLASQGIIGLVQTVPGGLPPGSDVANLSVMGYDPLIKYTGRAPLEAIGMGVSLNDHDVAFRCNLVTLSEEVNYEDKIMVDYSAGEIKSDLAAVLIKDLEVFLQRQDMKFYPGVSYRHLMVWAGGPADTLLTPPHDITGKIIYGHLPKGDGSDNLLTVMKESYKFLKYHKSTVVMDSRPANSLWFWGQGKSLSLDSFQEKFNLSGTVISAVNLIKGLGKCAGLSTVEVEGATGNIHTNFAGKTSAALEAFRDGVDLVYMHIEAPDEAGHQGNMGIKVRAIEEIDSKVLGPLLSSMREFGEFKIMLLPDHATPVSEKTHTADPVPFVIYDSRNPQNTCTTYCEEVAAKGMFVQRGYQLVEIFIKG